ncbi:MAG: acetyl-CoA carboxylase biotin carboxyl carrier protein [Phycisphaerales bacterium]|nr:acetyl-CoA carboxylase biotin carboxyl carrier protein [Phycisphaerales bacterium]
MDLKQIHELIKIISTSNIGAISIEDKDGKVTIKQKDAQIVTTISATPQSVATNVPVVPPPAPSPITTAQANAPAPSTSNLVTIKSPMIGTFYRKAAPDKPSLVDIGTEIKPGKVLCIIEAMKLFNEIEAEISGKIVKILVQDAQPVEFDQPLFLVEP